MRNPYLLDAKVKRWNNPRFAGGKVYMPMLVGDGFAKPTRRMFKRASEAEAYAIRARARWMRLYDAEVARLDVSVQHRELTS